MTRKLLARTLLVLLVAVVTAMFWQHSQYSDIRRELAQDRQSPLHGESLHVLTYLTAPPESELLTSLRSLRAAAEQQGSGLLIYAGKVVQNARDSAQVIEAMGVEVEWDAIILQQFESREAYNRYLQDNHVASALSAFPVRFAHGMRRSAALNLLLPQVLLVRKLQRTITLAPSIVPFETVSGADDLEISDLALSMPPTPNGFGEEAIVIVNLMLEGNAAQKAANGDYGDQMFSLMAEQQHGPIHMGASIPIDYQLDFSSIALVYYPGSSYLRDLTRSTFFQGIIGDKQLADTMVSITVPITDQL